MDKDEIQPQQATEGMDEEQQQQQQQVDDPYGFLVEQCIIPSAEENHLRLMPLFSPPTPTPTPPPPPVVSSVVKHEKTDEIKIMENSPPKENEAFSQQSPKTTTTSDEPPADADETPPSPLTEELHKTTEEEEHPHASLQKPPLEQQNEGLAQPQSPPQPPATIQTGQTHSVPPRFQPAAVVGPSSSSSSNPRDSKGEDNKTSIDILDVLRSKGFYVPRPRWWRPQGYDEDKD